MTISNSRTIKCVAFLALSLVFFAAPAQAARWAATNDTWIWIDQDSFKTQDGITYFARKHGNASGVPPEGEAGEADGAINCTTGEIYGQDWKGRRFDPAVGYERDYYEWNNTPKTVVPEYAAMLKRVVCGQ